jgi:hypothetical protein
MRSICLLRKRNWGAAMSVQRDNSATAVQTSHHFQSESDLLGKFERDVASAGLVGESKNAKVILLAAASARLQKPLNVSVGGSSAAGKNHLIGTVARFIPDEDQKSLTGMSPKVLMHSDEFEYQHKVVFIAEYEGVSGADYAIRTMQSEQRIEWEFVDTSGKGGIQKKKKMVRGPAAFIQATTRVTLHPENETRLLFVQMDESETQTRAINERQALEAEKRAPICPPDLLTGWHQLFRNLEQRPVRIPFAGQLAQHLPGDRIRSRRDFPKLLGLVETSAFLHQHQRARDEEGNIVAAPQDYVIAKELFEHCYFTGPESKVGELLQAAGQVAGENFSVADLIRETGWGKSKTYQVFARAEEMGCIVETETRGRYRLLRKHAEAPLSLPPKIRLTADIFRISTGGTPESFHVSGIPLQTRGDSSNGKAENRGQQSPQDGMGGGAARDYNRDAN